MKLLALLCIPLFSLGQTFSSKEISRFKAQSKNVTIIRDTWGIPHIYGKTDADAVFGLMYTQCEDGFNRVEMNSLEMLGRTAEIKGEGKLFADLQMRLIYDSSAAIADYKNSPLWFKKLLDASADGVNYYLYKHPNVKPALLHHFEPWFALMRTDGSIDATSNGGIGIEQIKAFYSGKESAFANPVYSSLPENVNGSNGFAVAPSKTLSHHAMLYINPHVTFYFREEVQMISDEGLNAYGAVTWGQFFVYQGFNEHCGWMHTSSHADVADVYKEKITKDNNGIYYQYNDSLLPVRSKAIELYYKMGDAVGRFPVKAYYTHHGPVLAGNGTSWLSVKEYNRSLKALMQSWLRTKARSYNDFEKTMDMKANTSNNTVYADDKGNIAYWHGDFMPRRDPAYDWSLPVDGTTSATEWKGVHDLKEIVQVHNPATGWIQNCNSTPYTVSGKSSPDLKNFPAYMAPDGQNARAINAMRLLDKENAFTLDKLTSVGYDTYLSAFEILLPSLFNVSLDLSSPSNDSLKLAIQLLKDWDKKSSEASVPTTIAIEWATLMSKKIPAGKTDEERSNNIGFLKSVANNVSSSMQILLLQEVLKDLQQRFGTWQVPWGMINRFQRANYDLGELFNDNKNSVPVGLASSTWGCLPAFNSVKPERNNYRYGVSGNSFVAAVEFGKKVKARTILTGGEGAMPSSKHFTDQADMYIHGKFKEVWFYKEDVLKHVEHQYHPGEENNK